jgi:hypothetical protein
LSIIYFQPPELLSGPDGALPQRHSPAGDGRGRDGGFPRGDDGFAGRRTSKGSGFPVDGKFPHRMVIDKAGPGTGFIEGKSPILTIFFI